MNAITVGAEYEFWRKARWVEGVKILNNTIEDHQVIESGQCIR